MLCYRQPRVMLVGVCSGMGLQSDGGEGWVGIVGVAIKYCVFHCSVRGCYCKGDCEGHVGC